MVKTENMPKAYKEVMVILNRMEEKYINMIPKEYINMMLNNMSTDYYFRIPNDTKLEDLEMLTETRCILANFYINYWGEKEDVEEIKKIINEDFILDEQKKKEQYPTDNVFMTSKDVKQETNTNDIKKNSEMQLREIKPNIIERIIAKIKKLFKK